MQRFQQQVQGDFVGVGILIRHNDKRELMVQNPLEGSPASRAGVEEKDRTEKRRRTSTFVSIPKSTRRTLLGPERRCY